MNQLQSKGSNKVDGSNVNAAESNEALYKKAFGDVIAFYNKHSELFKGIEHQFGVNIWFLQHFRIYFTYRESLANRKESHINRSKFNVVRLGLVFKKLILSSVKIITECLYMVATHKSVKPMEGMVILTEPFISDEQVFGRLESDFATLGNRELFNPKKPLPGYSKFKKNHPSVNQLIVTYLFGGSLIRDLLLFRSELVKLEKELKSRSVDVPEEKTISRLILENRFSLFIYFIRYRAFDAFFKQSNVTGLLMRDENSPQQKVIQYAARKHNVKVFAYQHGNIYRWNPAYMYSEYDVKPPLPDVTFVWGRYSADMLIQKGGYTEGKVHVSGRVEVGKEKRFKDASLIGKKPIIVYASQPQHDAVMRRKHLIDVLAVAEDVSQDYQLVLRPHPSETDDQYFLQAAKEVGCQNLIIDRNSDLKTHMEECSMLITAFSTVGTEFIPYYKPLLVLDYLGQDLMSWVKQDVGVSIANRKELFAAVNGQPQVSKNAYNQFVENHFYRIDGKAAERMENVINKRLSN